MDGKYTQQIKCKQNKKMRYLDLLLLRYPMLACCRTDIIAAFEVLTGCYVSQGKMLVCGNGGSAADAEHIVGELMKGFKNDRQLQDKEVDRLMSIDVDRGRILGRHLQGALPAIALDGHVALSTAYMNDCEPLLCFAQQVNGYGCEDDVFLGISTSGNSENVLFAAVTAKAKGMKVIGLTASKHSKLSALSDVCIRVPETETYRIQELHLPVYHCLCLMLEEKFFGDVK